MISRKDGHTVSRMMPLLGLFAIAFACLNVQGHADGRHSQPSEAIAQNYRIYVQGYMRKDAGMISGLYDKDAIVIPPRQRPITGSVAIRSFFVDYLKGDDEAVSENFTPVSLVVSGNYAIDVETYEGTDRRKSGAVKSYKGKNMLIWHRQPDGSWRIFRDMWSGISDT